MKKIFLYKISATGMLVLALAFLYQSCSIDKGEAFNDPRYLENFGISIYHVNPLTGEEYTEEELAELSYNPQVEERYSEGQMVELSVLTEKQPTEVRVLDGADLSIIETISSFSDFQGKHRALFSKSLEDLGLMEVDDVKTIKFEIDFPDGSIGAALFEMKRIVFVDPNAIFDTFVYLKKSTGETVPIRLESETLTNPWSYNGPYGAEVDFNGGSDKVEVTASPDIAFRNTENFSIGFWVNTTSGISDPSMVGDKDWGSGGNPGFVFAYTGGDWKFNVSDGNNRIDVNGNNINDGEWHYLAATFDRAGDLTVYEDGVSVGTASLAGAGDMNSNLPIFIGQDGTGNYGDWFEGKIGQVTLFDYALSPSEIAALSQPSTGVQVKLQDGTTSNVAVSNNDAVVSGEKGGLFVYEFDGSSQYATLNESELSFRHDGNYSISFWVNTTSGDSDPVMIGDQDWNSSGNVGTTIAFKGDNWRSVISDGTDKASENPSGSTFNDGEWHLLTVTYDRSGNMIMYQDGNAIATGDMSGLGDTNSGNPLRLAQDGPGTYGQFFQGKIGNVVVYDYVLTPEQISALLN